MNRDVLNRIQRYTKQKQKFFFLVNRCIRFRTFTVMQVYKNYFILLLLKTFNDRCDIIISLAAGSLADAAMVISQAKSKVMHIHRKTHVSSTTEAEVEALKLAHKCDACSRTFPTQRGMKIHAARWCDGGVTQRSRRGSLADRAVQTAKRRAAEALLSQVYVGNTPLENVYSFEYLGARMQCDGTDDADVRYRMAIAQTTFGSLSSIWTDHRLSRALKLMTYQLAVCSTLTHASEAWTLTEPVMRSVNGFNSRCLHIITGQDYRVTATAPEYDLLLAIRQRRLRYLGHILRMPESRVVRRALVALAKGGSVYPKGSLFMDCQTMKFHQLVALAQRRGAWNALATQLRWDGLPPYHWTPWVWDGTHTYIFLMLAPMLATR